MATIDKYLKVRKGVDTPDVLTSSATIYDYLHTPVVVFDTASTVNINYSDPGHLFWNYEEGTADITMNNGVSQAIGMEFFLPPTKNNSGVQIDRGDYVMATGVQGDRITIAKSINDGSIASDYFVGVAATNIAVGAEDGLVVVDGLVKQLNTSQWAVGTLLYPSSASAGKLTSIKPNPPSMRTPIAIVIRQDNNSGRILVRNSIGSTLGESDSNVLINSLQNNHILTYNQSASYWSNKSLSGAIQEVDGQGSGIDADLLDGQDGSYYAPIASATFTGYVNVPEPVDDSNAATKKYVDDQVGGGEVIVSSASAYPSSGTQHSLFFNTTSERMAIRVGSVWKELAFVSDTPVGGGDSSTLVFASSIDGGDSSTTTFVNQYDGGPS